MELIPQGPQDPGMEAPQEHYRLTIINNQTPGPKSQKQQLPAKKGQSFPIPSEIVA